MSSTTHGTYPVAHHFDTPEQQYISAELGMWLFLATEVLFFGGALCAYAVYRFRFPYEFIAGSHHLDVVIGTINTMVLLTSSLTMVLAVHAAQLNRRWILVACLTMTALLGATFLGIKAYEYHHKWEQRLVPGRYFSYESLLQSHDAASLHPATGEASPANPPPEEHQPQINMRNVELFFSFYFVLTGIHAVHMIIGIAIIGILVIAAIRGAFEGGRFTPIEMTGLYWHFVDIVWVFLFPLLYLVR